MAVHPLRPATRRRLGRPLPHQQADRPRAHPTPHKAFHHDPYAMVVCGIRPSFPGLSHSAGQITHVLLTRSPLEYPPPRWWAFPFDLHVLSTPPAFVLSQDQTLQPQHTQTNACVVHKNKNNKNSVSSVYLFNKSNTPPPLPGSGCATPTQQQ